MMVLRNDNGQRTVYLGKLYQHNLGTGSQIKHYAFNGKLVAMNEGGGYTFLLTDHLGSVNVTLAANGTIGSRLRYDPWGKQRYAQNVTPTGYRYTAQRFDDKLGLYDYNARYYDPAIGRFLSADTIVPDPTNPQQFNRFSYVANNPVRFIDPTGHFLQPPPDEVWDVIIGSIIAIPFKINALDPLADKLIDHYVYKNGSSLKLSETEMIATNAHINFNRNPQLQAAINELAKSGGGTTNISLRQLAGALTNGTLGNFTVIFEGTLTVTADENGFAFWELDGNMSFYDFWDFDKATHRSDSIEFKVWVGSFLKGTPFDVTSEVIPVQQNRDMAVALWANKNPQPVADIMGYIQGVTNTIRHEFI